jgi:uncharacterized protein YeaO (DUF488 family)
VGIRIVRLGSARSANEGPRIGTVRRPPRGVPKTEFARGNWYDVWYPNLAPSDATLKLGLTAQDDAKWKAFVRRYRAEMKQADAARSIALLATLSRHMDFSLGCYCENESRCHRSILRALLEEQGASLID